MKKRVKAIFEQDHVFIVIIVIALIAGAYLLFNYTNFVVIGKATGTGTFNVACIMDADCDAEKGFLCGLKQGIMICEMAGSNQVNDDCQQDDECQSRSCSYNLCRTPVVGCTTSNQAATCLGQICGRSTLFDSNLMRVVPSTNICELSRRNFNYEACLVHAECQSNLCGQSQTGYKECTKLYSEEAGSVCAANKECRSNSCRQRICAATTSTTKVCGNGIVEGNEQCDDWNLANGDGCSSRCQIEADYTCIGSPSVCTSRACGNGRIDGTETCDDGNVIYGDGCYGDGTTSYCYVEPGWACPGNVCSPVCGDLQRIDPEECDDGGTRSGDGCSATCRFECSSSRLTSCRTFGECYNAGGYWNEQSLSCGPKKKLGQACSSSAECVSNNCQGTCTLATAPYLCTGPIASHSVLCSSDDQGLTINTVRRLVSACTNTAKCEYTCEAGYILDRTGACTLSTALTPPTGVIPVDPIILDKLNQAVVVTQLPSSTALSCNQVCPSGRYCISAYLSRENEGRGWEPVACSYLSTTLALKCVCY